MGTMSSVDAQDVANERAKRLADGTTMYDGQDDMFQDWAWLSVCDAPTKKSIRSALFDAQCASGEEADKLMQAIGHFAQRTFFRRVRPLKTGPQAQVVRWLDPYGKFVPRQVAELIPDACLLANYLCTVAVRTGSEVEEREIFMPSATDELG